MKNKAGLERSLRLMATALSVLGTLSAGIAAHGEATDAKWGILVMAHGGDEAWDSAVRAAVEPVGKQYPTAIAFGMADRNTMETAVGQLEAGGVTHAVVVRMFISGDSFLERTEVILGLREPAHGGHAASHGEGGGGHHDMGPAMPIETRINFVLAEEALGHSPLVGPILKDRVAALSSEPERERILVLAHGPGDDAENERWLANMRLKCQDIHELGRFIHVQCETLREDWPDRREDSEHRIRLYVSEANRRGERVIVIPFRVANFGPYQKVLEGLEYVSDGAGFCPHPNVTQWIRETAARHMSETTSPARMSRHAHR